MNIWRLWTCAAPASERLLLLALAPLALCACGGTVESAAAAGDASTPPDAPVDVQADGPVGPGAPGCPSAAPALDSVCVSEGLLCEYGDDFSPFCNELVVCSGGAWAQPIVIGAAGATCPTPLSSVAPNPVECPSTRASVPAGGACTTPVSCAYDGSLCACGVNCPTEPVAFPPCNPDAGVTQPCCDTTKVTWSCSDGPPYCVTPRPRVGSACSGTSSCALTAPDACNQAILECESGVWNVGPTGCGAAAGVGGSVEAGEEPACTSDADCAAGSICGFAIADACTATGTCLVPEPVGCNAAAPGCACDGSEVNTLCNGLPSGYASAPLLHAGACVDSGTADGGACCPAGWDLYACTYPDGGTGSACHNPQLGCASSLTCGQGCDRVVTGRCGS